MDFWYCKGKSFVPLSDEVALVYVSCTFSTLSFAGVIRIIKAHSTFPPCSVNHQEIAHRKHSQALLFTAVTSLDSQI